MAIDQRLDTSRSTAQTSQSGLGTRLQGRRLRLVRLGWLITVASTCLLFVIAAPARYLDLSAAFSNLSPAQELALRNLGVPGAIQAGLVFTVEYLAIVAFVTIGIFIYWRRSDEWIAIFISASLTGYIAWTSPPLDALVSRGFILGLASEIAQSVGFVLAGAIFLYFPNGRIYPRWTVPLMPVLLITATAAVVLPSSIFDLTNPFRTQFASFLLLIAVRGIGMVAQTLRFFRVSTPVQRQQTKWILSSVSLAVIAYVIFGIDRIVVPFFSESRTAAVVYDLVWVPFFLICIIPIPIAFAYAILRHRLWDIDSLISRTLVYASLTAILAGLYTASITLTQRVFVAFTGERSSAAIALTTLAVAASFTPIRSWLQGVFDRYVKQRPDAGRNFRAFGNEVEAVLSVVDCSYFLSKSLDEAVTAFGATGGALYLGNGVGSTPYRTSGDWLGVAEIDTVFDCGNERYARIALGPRREGRGYSDADRNLLKETGDAIAETVRSVERAGFPTLRSAYSLAGASSGGNG